MTVLPPEVFIIFEIDGVRDAGFPKARPVNQKLVDAHVGDWLEPQTVVCERYYDQQRIQKFPSNCSHALMGDPDAATLMGRHQILSREWREFTRGDAPGALFVELWLIVRPLHEMFFRFHSDTPHHL